MDGEQKQKQLKDYTEEVAKLVPEYLKPLESGKKPSALPEVLGNLLSLEKKTRLAADAKSTVTVSTAILQSCWDSENFKSLNEHIVILTKRRAQLQKVVEHVIQYGAKLVKSIDVSKPGKEDIQRELIETLRTVSSGKMFVELERAQLTKILADMEVKAGKIKEAADILQEIQVETIGAMNVKEKASYLLDQVDLVLQKKDYVRTEIIAKKIAVKQFNEADAKTDQEWQELKLRYYKLMIAYHQHFSQYFEITKSYREMFNTNLVQNDTNLWKDVLTKLVLYGILSPWDAELSDVLHRIAGEKKLEQLPEIKNLLDEFIGSEIISWPLASEKVFQASSTFTDAASKDSSAMVDVTPTLNNELDVSETEAERKEGASSGSQRWNDFHKRVVQHNIRVVGSYYGRIRSDRLGQLLSLDPSKTEILLSEMVSSKQLYAKIDRPQGIITFTRPQPATETLNAYANDLSSLLNVVEKTCHMINKELMIHTKAK